MLEPRYIDTHAHLNLSAFKDDRAEVIKRTQEAGVAVINVGTKASTSQTAVEIASEAGCLTSESRESSDNSPMTEREKAVSSGSNCFAIIGLHPIQTVPGRHDEVEIGEGGQPFTAKGEVFDADFYRKLAKHPKVVGIGECGFDYYHNAADTYDVQEAAFIAQIELANELKLPLMIHTRGPKPGEVSPTGRSVYEDVSEVLKQYAKVPFNVHFYAGTLAEAKRFFELGGTISFTGVITFAKDYAEIVKNVPLEFIHAETDCPYVSPVPYRGKRCEPQYVIEVYKKIAAIRGEHEEKVREQLIKNAEKFYTLELSGRQKANQKY